MNWNDVIEIWEFVAAITIKESNDNYLVTEMLTRIEELQRDLKVFSDRFSTSKN